MRPNASKADLLTAIHESLGFLGTFSQFACLITYDWLNTRAYCTFRQGYERSAIHPNGPRAGGAPPPLGAGIARIVSRPPPRRHPLAPSARGVPSSASATLDWASRRIHSAPIYARRTGHRRLAQARHARRRPLGGWPSAFAGTAKHGPRSRGRAGRQPLA